MNFKSLKWLIRRPIIFVCVLFLIYYFVILISEFWNSRLASTYSPFTLKFSSEGITHFFVPIVAAVVVYATFEKYSSHAKLNLQSKLVVSECIANEYMMRYFRDNPTDLKKINEEGKYLEFRDYYIDRFLVEIKFIDICKCLEKQLNKHRNLTQQTIDMINNWLIAHRNNEIRNSNIEFFLVKLDRLKKEQKQLVEIINDIREEHGFERIAFPEL